MTSRMCSCVVAAMLLVATAASAQDTSTDDTRPAFSLASGQIFTTRERPAFYLTFRRVTWLDFRVYRVRDPLAFFAKLRDPHQLGSTEPIVPEERTWLERLASWKADRREQARSFVRRQFSRAYRGARRERRERQEVQLRRALDYNTFAQVPLLNASQLVSSWRELLPPLRDPEARRIPLDLREAGVYVVEAVSAPLRAYTVVIVSDLGLVTKTAPGQVLAFTANRFSGEPAADCDVQVLADQRLVASGRASAEGLFLAALPESTVDDVIAIARCGDQAVATDPGGWYLREATRELVGYIYTDKPIYRPGHTVHLKGVLRWRTRSVLMPLDQRDTELAVTDPNGKVVLRTRRPVDEFGAVHHSFPVSRGAALGVYTVQITSGDQQASGAFEVQEYRKPEFEVVVQPAERFIVQGGTLSATVRATYYFGQPVAHGRVQYVVHRAPYYSPLRWQEESDEESGRWFGYADEQQLEGSTRLDDQGNATIEVPLDVDENASDYTVRLEARVTDASSREVSGYALAHATFGRFLLTASADQYLYRRGARATLSVRAIDYTGSPQSTVAVNVWLEQLIYEQGRGIERATIVDQSVVWTDPEGRASWTTTIPPVGGSYRLRASAPDGDRLLQAQAYIWVPGATTEEVSGEEQYLELVTDKRSYAPGERVRLGVRGGAFEAPVLVTKEAQHVSYHRLVRPGAGEVVDVPIGDDDQGDVFVSVVYLKDDRVHRAEKRLSVPPTRRQLQITIAADQETARPQQPGTFSVRVTDFAGRPVRAQVSLGVVDEAVYGVKPDETPDAVRFFHRREYSRVGTAFSRDYSFVGYSGTQQLLLARRRRPFTLADFKADKPARPHVRKDFPDAIYWIADLVTDREGTAKVSVKYPDALTTWRLTARAITVDTAAGSAIARTVTTKDLILRVVTPRFLVEGDEVAIPAIVHNYLPDARDVSVALAANGLTPAEAMAPRSTGSIASGGERRLDWRFTAGSAGTATVSGTASTANDADALELSLPVLPFGLNREISRAGSLAGATEGSIELTIPEPSNPAARTIHVALAPSLAGSLLGALDFLTSYPYGCTEQTLSSFVPTLLVARALADLKLAPTERLRSVDRQVSEGVRRLLDFQHDDGGWGWWKTDDNQPFMTAYALYGLLEADAGGYKVDRDRMIQAAAALERLFREYPRAIPELKAYEIYVLALARSRGVRTDDRDDDFGAMMDEVWNARTRSSPYGQALLLLALDAVKDRRADELATTLAQSAVTKGDVTWWPSERDPLLDDLIDTTVEATAMAIKALASRKPGDPLIEGAVRWLLLNRGCGTSWCSTKQTALALYGLLEYMRARGETPTPFSVDVSVNGAVVGSPTFGPESWTRPDPIVITAPARSGPNVVRIVKRGAGVVYWSATARYFYNGPALERTGTRTLALAREYFSLAPVKKGDRIVYRQSRFGGAAQPGDLLLVRLTAAGANDWRYLMIEDPLPAGAEVIQQNDLYELEQPARDGYWSRREYRDDRVVLFQETFSRGRYEFVYLLKVISPGTFRAMPARISSMYLPDATASTDSMTLRVGG